MARPSMLLLTLLARRALAVYDQFFFAMNYTNSPSLCGNSLVQCPPPRVCVHEDVLDKYYCCGIGDDAVCFSLSTGCKDAKPGPNEIACGSNPYAYCCNRGKEECTQAPNQYNICWARADENQNPLQSTTPQRLGEIYSSLSSASPSATTLGLALELAQLLPSSSASISSSSTLSASETVSSGPPTSTQTSAPVQSSTAGSTPAPSSSSSRLSSGAIAGIVIGALVTLAVIAGGCFFWGRRTSTSKLGQVPSAELPGDGHAYSHGYDAVPGQGKYAHEMSAQRGLNELDSRIMAMEMNGNHSYEDGQGFEYRRR